MHNTMNYVQQPTIEKHLYTNIPLDTLRVDVRGRRITRRFL
jgi:hypothetical protein